MASINSIVEIQQLARLNARLVLKSIRGTKKDWSDEELMALEKEERDEGDQHFIKSLTDEGRDIYDRELLSHFTQFRFQNRLDSQRED